MTDEPLQPFPNEAAIKTEMSSWTDHNNGKRGFCAEGTGLNGNPITLTSYIWEYLGNPCPPEIYASTAVSKSFRHANRPVHFTLHQNNPNPFKSATIISFSTGMNGSVSLKIYDVLGREITTLVNEVKLVGITTVVGDGTNSAGRTVGGGM